MKNPLRKRYLRELRQDAGKYLVIFLFMVLMIGMVSGFLVTEESFDYLYQRSFTEQKIEDGHLAFRSELPADLKEQIENEADISLYPLYYFEEYLQNTEKKIRVYRSDREVNIPGMIRGKMPEENNEIALDRMFADNNGIDVGDTIYLKDRELLVSGLVALPDYTGLFENNTDMMFDAINFSVAVMSEEGFREFGSSHLTYNYAWLYPEFIERTDLAAAKKKSDALMEVLKKVLQEYDINIAAKTMLQQTADRWLGKAESPAAPELVEITDYLPRYLNQAINFTGDDMQGDSATFLVFFYILIVVLAFVFAITIHGTIASEAGVIGTLRASGYTKKELVGHYMMLPMLVSLCGAVAGNILGYTAFSSYFVTVYNSSFSFPNYVARWNGNAFLLTTVVPLLLMLIINFYMLHRMLNLSPLRFLRHDIGRKSKKKAFRLNTKIPFFHRFRMRIIFQNVPGYLTMFFGIFLGGTLVVFSTMFGPLLEDYRDLILSERICDQQYVLMKEIETENPQAEKYRLTQLKTEKKGYKEDDVSVFGIEEDSSYVSVDWKNPGVVISSALADKYEVKPGETLELKDPYDARQQYSFVVGGVYPYNAGMTVFMTKKDYAEKFGTDPEAFDGYFSNELLEDVSEDDVAARITVSDLTKISDQMTTSMGEMMGLYQYVGVFIFLLLMFLLTKQILEKNITSISMTKILGFYDGEIGGLYLAATSVIVVLSLLITIPLIDLALHFLFSKVMYMKLSGYIPYIVSNRCYVVMFVFGVCSYALVALLQMRKIRRIPKSIALKNVE